MSYFDDRDRLEAEQSIGQRASDSATGREAGMRDIDVAQLICDLECPDCSEEEKSRLAAEHISKWFQAGLAAAAKHRPRSINTISMDALYGTTVVECACGQWRSDRSGQSWADHIKGLKSDG